MSFTHSVVLRTALAALFSLAALYRFTAGATKLSYPQCTANTFGGVGDSPMTFRSPTSFLLGAASYSYSGPTAVYGVAIQLSTSDMGACESVHFSIALYSVHNFQAGHNTNFTLVATTADTVVYSTQGDQQILYIPFTTSPMLQATDELSYHLVAGFSSTKLVLYSTSPSYDTAGLEHRYHYNTKLEMPNTFEATHFPASVAVDLVRCAFSPTHSQRSPTRAQHPHALRRDERSEGKGDGSTGRMVGSKWTLQRQRCGVVEVLRLLGSAGLSSSTC